MSKPKAKKAPAEQSTHSISLAGKIGFAVLILLLAAAGAYLGLKVSGKEFFGAQGARFEDLTKEQQEKIQALAGGVKRQPRDLALRARFCHALLDGKLLDDAEECFEEILKITPANHEAYTHLGEIAFYRDKFDEALTLYNRARDLDPQFAHVYFNLGYLQMKAFKDYKAAREMYRKFLELEPKSPIYQQVKYMILQMNDAIGDEPGVPKEGQELVINPKDLMERAGQK